jgi:hypothetical protein
MFREVWLEALGLVAQGLPQARETSALFPVRESSGRTVR